MDELILAFQNAMMGIYERALSEADYKASDFLRMLNTHGGVETARKLINSRRAPDGYTALWERHRLDLTVEALIHDNPEWHPLFSADDLGACRRRLTEYGYFGPR